MRTRIKMKVNPMQSKKVQMIVFANGGCWMSGEREVKIEDKKYLYISSMYDLTWGYDEEVYDSEDYEEVDPELFIKTYGTCVELIDTETEEDIQELLDKEAELGNQHSFVLKQIKKLRGETPPVCWKHKDCTIEALTTCPWRIDCIDRVDCE
jgi:hypothetical protein